MLVGNTMANALLTTLTANTERDQTVNAKPNVEGTKEDVLYQAFSGIPKKFIKNHPKR